MPFNNKFYKYSVGIILILIIVYLIGKISYLLKPFGVIMDALFISIVVGVLFYYMIRPLVRFLSESKHINKSLSILIVFIFIGILIGVTVIYGGSSIGQEFNSFFNTLPSQFEIAKNNTDGILESKIGQYVSITGIQQKLIQNVEAVFKSVLINTGNVISAIANVGSQVILIPFILFYLLKDDREIYKGLIGLLPQKYKNDFNEIFGEIDETLSIYITGQLIIALVIGLLMYIGYLLIGMSNPMVLAIFSMITSIIPVLGTFIGILPAVFIALTIGFPMVIKVLVVLIVVQQLEGNLVSPYVIGNRLNIHPLTVVFIIIIFISLFGFIGGLLAIPTYAVIKVLIKGIFKITKNNKITE